MMNVAYALGRILLPLDLHLAGDSEADEHRRRSPKMLADNNVPIPDEIVPYLGGMPKYEALGYAAGQRSS